MPTVERITKRMITLEHHRAEAGTSKSGVMVTVRLWPNEGAIRRRWSLGEVKEVRDWMTKWVDRHGDE